MVAQILLISPCKATNFNYVHVYYVENKITIKYTRKLWIDGTGTQHLEYFGYELSDGSGNFE
jgi:hypothetical protein